MKERKNLSFGRIELNRQPLNVGVVGATGVVGQTFMKILEQRQFPVKELRPFASDASIGKQVSCLKKNWTVQGLKKNCFEGLDLVFFSSGDDISKEWAPQAAGAGAFAIDNSAAFRMHPEIPLVVPEVNGFLIEKNTTPQIIANPNCSTIQLVVALRPLDLSIGISEVRVASYQAVSGAGAPGQDELLQQMRQYQERADSSPTPKTFQKQILFNVIPQIGSFNEQGYSSEEIKIQKETKKILGRPDLKVSAMTVRVPTLNAHSEAVWVTLHKNIEKQEILRALSRGEGLEIEQKSDSYPTPAEVSGKDPVFVGRINKDQENPFQWLMWIVSDNLRKGAALNGIQIAEKLWGL